MKHVSVYTAIFFILCNCSRGYSQLLTESFDAVTFPPTGWTNVQISGAANPGTWQRLTSGNNPTATPHSGAGMAYYNAYSWSGGNAADLATPALDFSSGSFAVSFWMYRDAGQATKYDSVSVYVDVNTTSAGGTRLGVINRCRTFAPAETADGWYQYTFNIPGSFNTATNHIIFKGTSDFGNRMYIDDITVYSLISTADLTGVSATDTIVCSGSSVTLYAAGIDGTVNWYTGSCGGNLIGTGDSIIVAPSQTTTYYARNFNNNQNSTNCASLEITAHPVYAVSLNDTICAHQTYSLADGNNADTTGTYTVTVPSAYGCDSTVTVNLTVKAEITSSSTAQVCFGDSLLFNGFYYSQNGNYSDTLTASSGCDSIVTLTLTVLPQITTSLNQNICAGDSLLFNSNFISQNGTYADTLTASSGCDSIVTLTLTVLLPITTSINQNICAGDSLLFNANFISQNGAYADTLTASSGCDSIVTLTLTVLLPITTSINQNICAGDSLLFNGNFISQNGAYDDTLTAFSGCDSIVTLHLFLLPQITNTIGQSICNGDSLLYNGNYYSQPGTYADTLTSVNGCDSIIILDLTVSQIDTPVIIQNGSVLSVQNFASYQWIKDGTDIQDATSQTYTATANGMYSVRVTDANGCTAISVPVSVLGTFVSNSEVFSFSVFPNPVTDILHIISLSNNNLTVRIFNAVGEEITTEKQNGGSISVLHLPAGFYILSLTSGNYTHHRVFVKQ